MLAGTITGNNHSPAGNGAVRKAASRRKSAATGVRLSISAFSFRHSCRTFLRARGRMRKNACKEQVKNRRLGRVMTASCAATCFYLEHQRRKGAVLMVSPIQAFAKTDDR